MDEVLIIEAGKAEKNYWRDLWLYRELFYILSWRDIKVKYKQTVIGAAWGVIRPLLTMIVMVFVFGRVAGLASKSGTPYPMIVFAGVLPWQFFSTAFGEASGSMIGNTNLVSKVYFPRMIIPASSVITSLVDLAISFGILAVMMVFYRYAPPARAFFLPLFVILAFLISFGVGIFVSALNVKFRDFRYIIPFVIQFGTYICPVGYASENISEKYSETVRFWYSLNPMVGVIDGFRWCICGSPLYLPSLLFSIGMTILFLWLGIWYFRKTERSFADII
jgi:lipopolysaccharide transport system permease protein